MDLRQTAPPQRLTSGNSYRTIRLKHHGVRTRQHLSVTALVGALIRADQFHHRGHPAVHQHLGGQAEFGEDRRDVLLDENSARPSVCVA
jgi:hypothetical protein